MIFPSLVFEVSAALRAFILIPSSIVCKIFKQEVHTRFNNIEMKTPNEKDTFFEGNRTRD